MGNVCSPSKNNFRVKQLSGLKCKAVHCCVGINGQNLWTYWNKSIPKNGFLFQLVLVTEGVDKTIQVSQLKNLPRKSCCPATFFHQPTTFESILEEETIYCYLHNKARRATYKSGTGGFTSMSPSSSSSWIRVEPASIMYNGCSSICMVPWTVSYGRSLWLLGFTVKGLGLNFFFISIRL